MQDIVIHNRWALGDTVCLSALARDIQKAHPGKYRVGMTGHYANVFWLNNPYVHTPKGHVTGRSVELDYVEGIEEAGRGSKKHFLSWFHESFKRACGVAVPVTLPRGDIHLSPAEKRAQIPGRYWVVVAGGKWDMTAKVWSYAAWQNTVDALAADGIRCVQAGADFQRHFQPTLQNVHSVVGKTRSERDFFSLIYNAEGVICGVTAAMHIAAAFEKPCVVIAGGREEPWWEGYTNDYAPASFGSQAPKIAVPHRYLHTVGKLDCGIGNLDKGCWRARAVPLEQADYTNEKAKKRLCKKPLALVSQTIPECLAMISPDDVVAAVKSYYADGTLLPATSPASFVVSPTPAELRTPMPEPLLPADPAKPDAPALDHPYIGGKLTLFALGFGDHIGIIERCLNSIFATCPPRRIDVRVALNQPSKRVRDYVDGFGTQIRKVYVDDGSRRKYPAMRQMFHDPECPVETKYLCWFDDDSWCRDKNWLSKLADAIVANHANGGRLYGAKYTHDLMGGPTPADSVAWFRAASWWRGLPLHADKGRRTSPNGSEIVFASGGFWALDTSVMRTAEIPDARLSHNGGDVTIGLQVAQAGYKTVDFSPRPNKAIIAWSDSPRRGITEKFPWLPAS